MTYAIEIRSLSVYYNNLCALDSVNLNVKEQEFLGIIGPSGGGKSTLLKSVLNLVKPSSGSIKIFGQPLRLSLNQIGYVPQNIRFDRHFPINVKDVVLMGRISRHKPLFLRYKQADLTIVSQILKDLEIGHLIDRQIGQLSGGQLQRVLLARALAVEPRILLLDEPTSNVDSYSKTLIYSILKELSRRIAVIVVTHDIWAISSLIDQVACLNVKLHYHGGTELNDEIIQNVFGCPVDLIAHGVPHRIYRAHEGV
ncbi:MAG: metal ABC transporter ATP-binding protein [Desulfotomaculaceae bacterium]|nr:metal ABC transporter ATP-binding protein [Desulfotomaculaceae bacterium]